MSGEVKVEELRLGDQLTTLSGVPAIVRWIGRRKVTRKFADPMRALPIRIKAGALDDKSPSRDLFVSPDHAIFLDDILIQAGALVNGVSIIRDLDAPPEFNYHHIEADKHVLIFAEGVAAETFVDNLDRMAFDNWEEHLALYPNGNPIAELPYPRAKAHRQVPISVREKLAERAAALYGARISTAA